MDPSEPMGHTSISNLLIQVPGLLKGTHVCERGLMTIDIRGAEILDNGKGVEVSYHPGEAHLPEPESLDDAQAWRKRVRATLASHDVVEVHELK